MAHNSYFLGWPGHEHTQEKNKQAQHEYNQDFQKWLLWLAWLRGQRLSMGTSTKGEPWIHQEISFNIERFWSLARLHHVQCHLFEEDLVVGWICVPCSLTFVMKHSRLSIRVIK